MGNVTPPNGPWTRREIDELGPGLRSYVESHAGDICERVCPRCKRAFTVPRGSRQCYRTAECADADKARRYRERRRARLAAAGLDVAGRLLRR